MGTWDQLFIFVTALFSIVNPIGAVPVFLSLTADRNEYEKRHILRGVIRNMLLMLLVIMLFGTFILSFFGLSLEAIRIAGAILIIANAFNLLRSTPRISEKTIAREKEREDISLAPLTMPLLVGPGTIAIIVSYSNQLEYAWSSAADAAQYAFMFVSIIAVVVASYFILKYSIRLLHVIGNSGVLAISKVMGFLLLSVGAQMLIETGHELWARQ